MHSLQELHLIGPCIEICSRGLQRFVEGRLSQDGASMINSVISETRTSSTLRAIHLHQVYIVESDGYNSSAEGERDPEGVETLSWLLDAEEAGLPTYGTSSGSWDDRESQWYTG